MATDCKITITVLGEAGVGKTSLLHRFTKGIFKPNLTATTIIDCYSTQINIKDLTVNVQLWDTGGQERFFSIVRQYFRKADGVLLVYDVTNITSFHKLSSWFLQLRSINDTAVAMIVGNKVDEVGKKLVSVSMVKSFAEQEKLDFVEVSAKTGDHVDQIFELITEKILKAKQIIPSSLPRSVTNSKSGSSRESSGISSLPNSTNRGQVQQDRRSVPNLTDGHVIKLPVNELKNSETRTVKKKSSCC